MKVSLLGMKAYGRFSTVLHTTKKQQYTKNMEDYTKESLVSTMNFFAKMMTPCGKGESA